MSTKLTRNAGIYQITTLDGTVLAEASTISEALELIEKINR
jgi:hypothetical protein